MNDDLSLDQISEVLKGLEAVMDYDDMCDAEHQRLEWAHETLCTIARRMQDAVEAGQR